MGPLNGPVSNVAGGLVGGGTSAVRAQTETIAKSKMRKMGWMLQRVEASVCAGLVAVDRDIFNEGIHGSDRDDRTRPWQADDAGALRGRRWEKEGRVAVNSA